MKISDRIYLAGSEQFALSHPLDCNCYLIDGGNASGLIDTGLGLGVDDILKNVAEDGFDPGKISHVWKYKLPVFLSGQSSGWGTVARAREFEKYLKSGSGRAFANRHLW